MDEAKKQKLEVAGWQVGSAEEFLSLPGYLMERVEPSHSAQPYDKASSGGTPEQIARVRRKMKTTTSA